MSSRRRCDLVGLPSSPALSHGAPNSHHEKGRRRGERNIWGKHWLSGRTRGFGTWGRGGGRGGGAGHITPYTTQVTRPAGLGLCSHVEATHNRLCFCLPIANNRHYHSCAGRWRPPYWFYIRDGTQLIKRHTVTYDNTIFCLWWNMCHVPVNKTL